MDPAIAEQREALELELERVEALLALNASWQALCLLKIRSGDGVAALDPQLGAERARLEAALAGNRVFQQREAVARAIAAIDEPVPEVLVPEPGEEPVVETPLLGEDGPAIGVAEPQAVSVVPDGEPAEPQSAAGVAAQASFGAGDEAPLPASLVSRLRRVRQTSGFDGARYAAYRSEIGEASVEIVKRGDAHSRSPIKASGGLSQGR
jgi:hypothetical protein